MKNHEIVFTVKESSVIGFVPKSLAIDAGDSVTFINTDTAAHTVKPDDGKMFGLFIEIPLAANVRRRLTAPTDSAPSNRSDAIVFDHPGSYGYQDQFGHKGTIVVKGAK